MNIFASFECPKDSAYFLDNKRLVKMCLESAQLLSTAMCVLNIENAPYRKTHVNHPCAVWVRSSRGNYLWLLEHFKALCQEYTRRFGKCHACEKFAPIFEQAAKFIPEGPREEFVNCTANFKHISDVCLAYRLQLVEKWKHDRRKPTWSTRRIQVLD